MRNVLNPMETTHAHPPEYNSGLHLKDSYLFNLPSQGNIYSIKGFFVQDSDKILVGTLNRKLFCLDFGRLESSEPQVKDLQFTYIPSGAEVISLDAFCRFNQDIVIGITIIKVQPSDGGSGGVCDVTASAGGQYFNIYSDWEQPSPNATFDMGHCLENLCQSCLSLELDFIPYQLTHWPIPLRRRHHASGFGGCSAKSGKEMVWLLLGSDCRIHMYMEDHLSHAYVEAPEALLKANFPEFGLTELPSVPIWLDMLELPEQNKRLTAVGCEDGELLVWMVDVAETATTVVRTFSEEFPGTLSQLRFFRPLCSDLQAPSELQQCAEALREASSSAPIHLLAVSMASPSVVFLNVTESGLDKANHVKRSDEFDAPTCAAIVDIDFDGEHEILIGTFGQELLAFKCVGTEAGDCEGQWQLLWTRSFGAPILGIKVLDLLGDGIEEIVLLTTKGVQVLRHDPEEVVQLLRKRALGWGLA